MDFKIFCSAVITTEGLTLDASRALLRDKNFDGKTNICQTRKRQELGRLPSGSLKISFEVIFSAKMDSQIFCSAVIPSEGLTLEAFRTLLRHKNLDCKTNMSKIEKDEDWVG